MSSPDNSDIDESLTLDQRHTSQYAYPLKSNPDWADLTPIQQSDNNLQIVTIQYNKRYDECLCYLRAVIQLNEQSIRVLYLTKQVIEQDSAHYTAWYYRRLSE